MPGFLTDIFIFFNITDELGQWSVLILVCVWLAALLLRIVLSAGYQGQYAMIKFTAKDIKSKAEIEKVRSAYFARSARDFIALAERGAPRIDSRELAEKNALRFNFLLWNYKSIESFVSAMENNLLLIGIIAAVITGGNLEVSIAAGGIFLLSRIFAAIFDFQTSCEKLYSETAFQLDRELGKFFSNDTPSAIGSFKSEMRESLTAQAKFLETAIKDLGARLSESNREALAGMSGAVEKTLAGVTISAETIREPLDAWKDTLKETDSAYIKMNTAVSAMSAASENFKGFTEGLSGAVSGFKDEIITNNQNLEKQIEKLAAIAESISQSGAKASAETSALGASIEFVKTNQSALEKSLGQYETTLKELASSLGDGFGRIIGFHLQESCASMVSGMTESIKQANAANGDFLPKLQSLFDRLLEQSQTETTLIMRLKEQMELEIDGLKKSVSAAKTNAE